MKRSVKELWHDYLFLTKEMNNALKREDVDLFEEIMNQRERLQEMLGAVKDEEFKKSPERHELLRLIEKENAEIARELRSLFNRNRRKREVDNAYTSNQKIGKMNWQG